MKRLSESLNNSGIVNEARGKFRMFFIWIEGGGTPMFVLSAEDEEEAYESANTYYNMWRNDTRGKAGNVRIKNPISDVRELPGVYSDKPVCYDLHQDGKGAMKNFSEE